MHTLDTHALGRALDAMPPYAPDAPVGLYRRERTRQRRKHPLLARLDPAAVEAATAEADAIIERTQSLARVLAQLKPIPSAAPIPEFGL